MSDYRRYFVQGGTYFFTVVTEGRAPMFQSETARTLLGNVMRQCFVRYPVEVAAIVVLPDHIHTLWTLPTGDDRYSLRWRWIKREFTRAWLARGGAEQPRGARHSQQGNRGVWQRRYWEHTIRDESDMEAHFDYVHYNPVKHQLAQRPADWPWSSFHRWVRAGHYPPDWAAEQNRASWPAQVGE